MTCAGVPTVFSVIMASMADINKVFNINTYLPVILVVHCAMVALGIWERLFNMCVSEKFRFSTDDIDDEYTEKVGELDMLYFGCRRAGLVGQ